MQASHIWFRNAICGILGVTAAVLFMDQRDHRGGGGLCLLSSNKSDVSEDEDDSGDEGDKYYDDLSIMAYR